MDGTEMPSTLRSLIAPRVSLADTGRTSPRALASMSETSRSVQLPALGQMPQQPQPAQSQTARAASKRPSQPQQPRGRPAVYVGSQQMMRTEEYKSSISLYSPTNQSQSRTPISPSYDLLAEMRSIQQMQQLQLSANSNRSSSGYNQPSAPLSPASNRSRNDGGYQMNTQLSPNSNRYGNDSSGYASYSASAFASSPSTKSIASPRKRSNANASRAIGARPTLSSLKLTAQASSTNLLSPTAHPIVSPTASSTLADTNSVVFVPPVQSVQRQRVHLMRSKPFLTSGLTPGSYVTYQPTQQDGRSSSPTFQASPGSPRRKQLGSSSAAAGGSGAAKKHLLAAHKPAARSGAATHNNHAVAEKLRQHQIADEQRKREFEDIQLHAPTSPSKLGRQTSKSMFSSSSRLSLASKLNPHDPTLIVTQPPLSSLQFGRDQEVRTVVVQNMQASVVTVQARIESTSEQYHLLSTQSIYLYPGQSLPIQVRADFASANQQQVDEDDETGEADDFSSAATLILHAQPLSRSYAGTSAKHAPRKRMHQQTRITLERADRSVAPVVESQRACAPPRSEQQPAEVDLAPTRERTPLQAEFQPIAAPEPAPAPAPALDVKPEPEHKSDEALPHPAVASPRFKSKALSSPPKSTPQSPKSSAASSSAELPPAAAEPQPLPEDPLLAAIELAVRKLEGLKGVKTDLLAYSSTPQHQPPASVLNVLECVQLVLLGQAIDHQRHQYALEWKGMKETLKQRDFLTRVRQLSLLSIPPRVLRSLAKLMSKQNYDAVGLAKESPPAAALAEWVLAVEAWLRRAHPKELPQVDPDVTVFSAKNKEKWLTLYGKVDAHVAKRAQELDVHLVAFAMPLEEQEATMVAGLGQQEAEKDGFYRHYPPLGWSPEAEQRVLFRLQHLSPALRRAEYAHGYRAHRMYSDHADPLLENTKVVHHHRSPVSGGGTANAALRRRLGTYTSFPSIVTPAFHIALQRRARMRVEMSVEGEEPAAHRLGEESSYRLDSIERMVDQRLTEVERMRLDGATKEPTMGLTEEEHIHIPLLPYTEEELQQH
jgi:hypothetical protein